jgi:hypothetical protein
MSGPSWGTFSPPMMCTRWKKDTVPHAASCRMTLCSSLSSGLVVVCGLVSRAMRGRTNVHERGHCDERAALPPRLRVEWCGGRRVSLAVLPTLVPLCSSSDAARPSIAILGSCISLLKAAFGRDAQYLRADQQHLGFPLVLPLGSARRHRGLVASLLVGSYQWSRRCRNHKSVSRPGAMLWLLRLTRRIQASRQISSLPV